MVRVDTPATWRADNRELLVFLVDAKRRVIRDERREGAPRTSAYTRAPFAIRAGALG